MHTLQANRILHLKYRGRTQIPFPLFHQEDINKFTLGGRTPTIRHNTPFHVRTSRKKTSQTENEAIQRKQTALEWSTEGGSY